MFNRALIVSFPLVIAGVVGFMLPQHITRVQKLQAVFIIAEEQIEFSP